MNKDAINITIMIFHERICSFLLGRCLKGEFLNTGILVAMGPEPIFPPLTSCWASFQSQLPDQAASQNHREEGSILSKPLEPSYMKERGCLPSTTGHSHLSSWGPQWNLSTFPKSTDPGPRTLHHPELLDHSPAWCHQHPRDTKTAAKGTPHLDIRGHLSQPEVRNGMSKGQANRPHGICHCCCLLLTFNRAILFT